MLCVYGLGCTVGHRSLQRYYRQNLKPERAQVSTALSKVMAQYKALGWTGTTGRCILSKVTAQYKALGWTGTTGRCILSKVTAQYKALGWTGTTGRCILSKVMVQYKALGWTGTTGRCILSKVMVQYNGQAPHFHRNTEAARKGVAASLTTFSGNVICSWIYRQSISLKVIVTVKFSLILN